MTDPRDEPRVIVALDYPDVAAALALVDRLDPSLCRLKVGKELFVRAGPDLVRCLVGRGYAVFLDLKFHDLPSTVAAACRAAADLGVWLMNVHAWGGLEMMRAARAALGEAKTRPRLLAVTVLTGLDTADLRQLGLVDAPATQVERLARLAREAGLDGVVCSAREAGLLRQRIGADFMLVTPGIRPVGAARDDQSRTLTPAAAVAAGADYLVIGRPITQAADPLSALLSIRAEISTPPGERP